MNEQEFRDTLNEFDWVTFLPDAQAVDFVLDPERSLRWNELFYFCCFDWAGHYFVSRGWDFKRLQLEGSGFRFLLNKPHPCRERDLDRLIRDIVDMIPHVEAWQQLAEVYSIAAHPKDLNNQDMRSVFQAQFSLPTRAVLREYLTAYEAASRPETERAREREYELR